MNVGNVMRVAPQGNAMTSQKRRPGRPRTGTVGTVGTVGNVIPSPSVPSVPSVPPVSHSPQTSPQTGQVGQQREGYEILPDTPKISPKLLTLDDAALVLSVKRSTVERLLRIHQLGSVKIGAFRRIKRTDLDAYIDALEYQP